MLHMLPCPEKWTGRHCAFCMEGTEIAIGFHPDARPNARIKFGGERPQRRDDIKDVTVENVFAENCMTAIRFLSITAAICLDAARDCHTLLFDETDGVTHRLETKDDTLLVDHFTELTVHSRKLYNEGELI